MGLSGGHPPPHPPQSPPGPGDLQRLLADETGSTQRWGSRPPSIRRPPQSPKKLDRPGSPDSGDSDYIIEHPLEEVEEEPRESSHSTPARKSKTPPMPPWPDESARRGLESPAPSDHDQFQLLPGDDVDDFTDDDSIDSDLTASTHTGRGSFHPGSDDDDDDDPPTDSQETHL